GSGLACDLFVNVAAATVMRGAVDGAVRRAVRHACSDRDPSTFAVTPTSDDDTCVLVEPDGRSCSCLEKPPRLLGDGLEHLLRRCRRGDERRDAAKRRMLFAQVIS